MYLYITYVYLMQVLLNLAGYLLNATAAVSYGFFSSNDFFIPMWFFGLLEVFPGGDLGSITS